jgi:hypothetical protein
MKFSRKTVEWIKTSKRGGTRAAKGAGLKEPLFLSRKKKVFHPQKERMK